MHIIILAAVTLDGKMARHAAHLSNWTSLEDKRLFREVTKRAGVVIVGHNTFKTLARPLPARLNVVLTRDPHAHPDTEGVVEYTDALPRVVLERLEARGYTEAVVVGGGQINALFLRDDLVDEIWLTVEPVIFGQGIGVFEGVAFDRRARLLELRPLNRDAFLLRYGLRE